MGSMADEEETPQVSGGKMDLMDALKECLRKALIHDGVARGLHECAKALDRRQAHLCVLASNCNEPAYTKLVEALCAEHQINLLKVADCSCAVIHDYGEDSEARNVLLEHLKSQ